MQITFFRAEDQATLNSWFSSQLAVTQWAGPGVNWPLSAEFLKTLLDSDRQQPASLLTFAGRVEGELAVVAQLGFDWDNHLACLCRVVVNPGMRGQKLAGKMLQTLLANAFRQQAIERVELHVYPFNTAAVRTYEQLGFVREGVRRHCVVVGDERWDCALYGMLRTEYAARSTVCISPGSNVLP